MRQKARGQLHLLLPHCVPVEGGPFDCQGFRTGLTRLTGLDLSVCPQPPPFTGLDPFFDLVCMSQSMWLFISFGLFMSSELYREDLLPTPGVREREGEVRVFGLAAAVVRPDGTGLATRLTVRAGLAVLMGVRDGLGLIERVVLRAGLADPGIITEQEELWVSMQ